MMTRPGLIADPGLDYQAAGQGIQLRVCKPNFGSLVSEAPLLDSQTHPAAAWDPGFAFRETL